SSGCNECTPCAASSNRSRNGARDEVFVRTSGLVACHTEATRAWQRFARKGAVAPQRKGVVTPSDVRRPGKCIVHLSILVRARFTSKRVVAYDSDVAASDRRGTCSIRAPE